MNRSKNFKKHITRYTISGQGSTEGRKELIFSNIKYCFIILKLRKWKKEILMLEQVIWFYSEKHSRDLLILFSRITDFC